MPLNFIIINLSINVTETINARLFAVLREAQNVIAIRAMTSKKRRDRRLCRRSANSPVKPLDGQPYAARRPRVIEFGRVLRIRVGNTPRPDALRLLCKPAALGYFRQSVRKLTAAPLHTFIIGVFRGASERYLVDIRRGFRGGVFERLFIETAAVNVAVIRIISKDYHSATLTLIDGSRLSFTQMSWNLRYSIVHASAP